MEYKSRWKQPKCPGCKSGKAKPLYLIARGIKGSFAGTELPSSYDSGILYECSQCNLSFRWPTLSESQVQELYRDLDPGFWQMSENPEWGVIKQKLEKFSPSRKLLDFGCFTGDFLEYMNNSWECYGVEPSLVAANKARSSAAKVWGEAREIPSNILFGSIVMMDVFEHLSNPYEILVDLVGKLEPNGVLILLSGNSHALSWRIMKGNYWYLSMPEHICFYNRKWLDWFCRNQSMQLISVNRVSIVNGNKLLAIKQAVSNLLFSLVNSSLGRTLRSFFVYVPVIKKVIKWKTPVPWSTAKDHLLVVIRKEINIG